MRKQIVASRSEVKFTPPMISSQPIEVFQCAQAMKLARLNFALVSLLVACSIDPLQMQDYFVHLAEPEVKYLLTSREVFLAGYYLNSARCLKMQVPQSRRLDGVADFRKIFKGKKVYVSISGHEKIVGRVLVTKEPCFDRADLRCLEAVDDRRFHHLKDAIVFSCRGKHSEPSQMSGSDLHAINISSVGIQRF